jgi:hypothetical protein
MRLFQRRIPDWSAIWLRPTAGRSRADLIRRGIIAEDNALQRRASAMRSPHHVWRQCEAGGRSTSQKTMPSPSGLRRPRINPDPCVSLGCRLLAISTASMDSPGFDPKFRFNQKMQTDRRVPGQRCCSASRRFNSAPGSVAIDLAARCERLFSRAAVPAMWLHLVTWLRRLAQHRLDG